MLPLPIPADICTVLSHWVSRVVSFRGDESIAWQSVLQDRNVAFYLQVDGQNGRRWEETLAVASQAIAG